MSDTPDYMGLEWLREEISNSLSAVSTKLEDFAQNTEQTDLLADIVADFEQVRGSLQILELEGALLIAQEMEALAKALSSEGWEQSQTEDALQELVKQCIFLPNYLEKLQSGQSGQTDSALSVLSVANAMRGCRGDRPISPVDYFHPSLDSLIEYDHHLEWSAGSEESIRKLRQAFQVAFAKVLRDEDTNNQLKQLYRVVMKLEQMAAGSLQGQVWWVSVGYLDALQQLGTSGNAARYPLRQLDEQIRSIVEQKPAPRDQLLFTLKSLLFFVAATKPSSKRLKEIRRVFAIEGRLPLDESGEGNVLSLDRATMQTIAQGLNEEIAQLKDQLEIFVRDQDAGQEDLAALLPGLDGISATLSMLELDDAREIVQEQISYLESIFSGENEVQDEDLMNLAGQLLLVETSLNVLGEEGANALQGAGVSAESRLSDAHHALLAESAGVIEEVKNGLISYMAAPGNKDQLSSIVDLLAGVGGAFAIIPLVDAADIVQYMRNYLNDAIESSDPIDSEHLDMLADAVISIEYYIERLSSGVQDNAQILDFAKKNLASLVSDSGANTDSAEAEDEPPAHTLDVELLEAFVEESNVAIDRITEIFASLSDDDNTQGAITSLSEVLQSLYSTTNLVDASYIRDLVGQVDLLLTERLDQNSALQNEDVKLLMSVFEVLPTWIESFVVGTELDSPEVMIGNVASYIESIKLVEAPSVESSASEAFVDLDDEDDLIDDEILEIFIEEAAEVQETIESYFPKLAERHDDQEALTELRRAYHTLKGSGRLVGAEEIGETAWSLESLLNKVIDGAVQMNDAIIEHLAYMNQLLPGLVGRFGKKVEPLGDLETLQARAAALASDEEVEALPSHSILEGTTATEPTLLDIFLSEAKGHLKTLDQFLETAQAGALFVDDALSRALHTLKGGAGTADLPALAAIAIPTEKFVKELRSHEVLVEGAICDVLIESRDLISQALTQAESGAPVELDDEQFLASLNELRSGLFGEEESSEAVSDQEQQPSYVEILLSENLNAVMDGESILEAWEQDGNETPLVSLAENLSELGDECRGHNLIDLADWCADSSVAISLRDDSSEASRQEFSELLRSCLTLMLNAFDQMAAGLTVQTDQTLSNSLKAFVAAQQVRIESSQEELHDSLDELDQQLDSVLPSVDDGSDSEYDEEVLEIFLEEAKDIISGLEGLLDQIEDSSVLQQLERDCHTLKGGARMARVQPMAELAQAMEKRFAGMLLDTTGEQRQLTPEISESAKLLQTQLFELEAKNTVSGDDDLVGKLESGETISIELPDEPELVVEPTAVEVDPEPQAEPEPAVENTANAEDTEELVSYFSSDLDPELVDIFLEEARDIIANSADLLHRWESDHGDTAAVEELQRDLHTLKGGARMAEIKPIGDLSHELETLFEFVVERGLDVTDESVSLCLKCHDALATMVENLETRSALPASDELCQEVKVLIRSLSTGAAEESPKQVFSSTDVEDEEANELLETFMEESKDILNSVASGLEQWAEDIESNFVAQALQREMHTLKGAARLSDVDAIGDVAAAGEEYFDLLLSGHNFDRQAGLLLFREVHAGLEHMLVQLESLGNVDHKNDLITRLKNADVSAPLLDPDMLEIFGEEARELSTELEELIAKWQGETSSQELNQELQRVLHTLKGGARMANFSDLADVSHDLETRLVEAADNTEVFEGELETLVLEKQDQILKLIDAALGNAAPIDVAPAPEPESQAIVETIQQAKAALSKAGEAKKAPAKTAKSDPKVVAEAKPSDASKPQVQETIRVSADLMEELVNLAGETSISRGRLETQISEFGFSLEEMTATIERLREQLRRMEIETEAQVLFRAEKEGFAASQYEEFDPLELDRYSSIQQLSRSLSESATDLAELRESLADKARGAETLLLQQQRITSELQEGLMKTRMIPFSSMVPRLRRVARQISTELNKQISFDVSNAEGEMDRSILERMIAPLEHMLRNAIDHGIEDGKTRKKNGKPEAGHINLSLAREGGNVVLKMSDDGGGIDDQKVLQTAIKRGIVEEGVEAKQHDILQFIMLPGFSTAEKVTQISGRGVGMDVVASEIKQMGGSIEIDSSVGQGTDFTVRLPFTVSLNRALMVTMGDSYYAIPLNMIEGIVRVTAYELEEYYQPDAPLYEYAGQSYHMKYLGQMLNTGTRPKLQGQPLPLPVILVRGSEYPVALQVDSLMGSREIVVKSLGPQFGKVHAVSGATILGDGSVVIILDLPALIRNQSRMMLGQSVLEETPIIEHTAPTVMVVDDSVTVRKVTTRLLERHGMEVVTAKDGVDAIAQLQDIVPDVILLDIEMPRMDGFEVATLVRHDERLKHVPIIMITSRTGSKHRERAMSIGVNEYLGKPFQEQILLENIAKITQLDVAHTIDG